jgi:hypothetical protein
MKSQNHHKTIQNLIAITIILFSMGVLFFLFRTAFLNMKNAGLHWLIDGEEHFSIGENLYKTGEMSRLGHINTERPAGYPVYVSVVLHTRDLLVRLTSGSADGHTIFGDVVSTILADNQLAIIISHILLSGLAGWLFFILIRDEVQQWISYSLLVCFMLNIHMFSLMMQVDYSLMEVDLIFLMFLCFIQYQKKKNKITIILLGVIVGISCLVRPVYLLFPAFFFLYEWIESKWQFWKSVKMAAILAGIMLLTMSPNVIRNYRVAHKFILVSEQGGVELYHNAVVSFWQQPKYMDYNEIWSDYGWPLMRDGLGIHEYSGELWYSDTARVSKIYWTGAVNALKNQPLVYIGNVIYNIKDIFWANLAYWGSRFYKTNEKFIAGYRTFQIYLSILFYLGTCATVICIFKREKSRLEKSNLFMAGLLLLSYSLVFFYPRYTYFKIPIFFLSIAICLNWLMHSRLSIIRSRILGGFIVVVLLISSILPLFYFYIYHI